jgi:hypothetical protein
MLFVLAIFMALVSAVSTLLSRPSLQVPACPAVGTVSYNTSVPDKGLFPQTTVDLCYDGSSIHIKFTALEEKDFYCTSTGRPFCRQESYLLAPPRQPESHYKWRNL